MSTRTSAMVGATTVAILLAGCSDTEAPAACESPGRADQRLVIEGNDALDFEPATATVSAGDVTVTLVNTGSVAHTLVIEEPPLELSAPGGVECPGSITLTPGEYTFFCDVPGHREAGMEGVLTAE